MLAPKGANPERMGCLSELVGLDVTCQQRDGKTYVGELGITEKELSDYMSADSATIDDFIADRVALAERWVMTDMLTRLAPRMIGKTFVDRGRLGEYDERQTLMTAPVNTEGGMVLDVCQPGSNLKLLVSSLSVWSDVGGDVDVVFTDLTDGTVLHTETIEATTADKLGTKAVDITISIPRKKMRVLVATDLPSYYRTTLHGGSCTTCGSKTYRQGPVEVYGAYISSAATVSYANIQRATHTSGLSIVLTVACDHEAFVCEHKGLLALPMGFKVAEEVVSYGLGNFDRINARIGTGNRDALVARRDEFARKYADAMGRLWDNMPTPTDAACFVCNSMIRRVVALP